MSPWKQGTTNWLSGKLMEGESHLHIIATMSAMSGDSRECTRWLNRVARTAPLSALWGWQRYHASPRWSHFVLSTSVKWAETSAVRLVPLPGLGVDLKFLHEVFYLSQRHLICVSLTTHPTLIDAQLPSCCPLYSSGLLLGQTLWIIHRIALSSALAMVCQHSVQ